MTSASPDDSGVAVGGVLIDCPNRSCRAQFFKVTVHRATRDKQNPSYPDVDRTRQVGVGEFTFLPTCAQPLSAGVPKHVGEDYNEAYLIASLSPKASATLARRALQGMVRDFFSVTGKKTLHAELEAIQDRCDSDLYDAMTAVKSIGNIGAHPEQNVSLIVDVEPGEAETLLKLIHLLDREWYVARADKASRIAKMKELGVSKAIPKA
ncbi:DUF4145 domain-containing protein [Acidovorax sp. CF316]|uniref:DUF4145 domain-containing protein n=1 Tax=Acidovorax sp. CF316 TaxID=1144317 RepID=UPI0012F80B93|nr:DUF4145 domain-containing protein [Acidovorax sp. CF316]